METKLEDLKIGEQFVINGNTYTKLNEQGYCVLDKYNASVANWAKFMAFDSKENLSNNFDKSTIKEYINSKFFKNEILGIADYLKPNTEITLLSVEELEEYKEQIKKFFAYSWSRSPRNSYPYLTYRVDPSGSSFYGNPVYRSCAVRPALYLNPESIVLSTTAHIKDSAIAELQAQLNEIQEKIDELKK